MFFEFLVWSELVVLVSKDIAHDSSIIHVITRFLKADLDGTIFAYDYRGRLAYFMTFDHPHAHNLHLRHPQCVVRM